MNNNNCGLRSSMVALETMAVHVCRESGPGTSPLGRYNIKKCCTPVHLMNERATGKSEIITDLFIMKKSYSLVNTKVMVYLVPFITKKKSHGLIVLLMLRASSVLGARCIDASNQFITIYCQIK